MTAANAHFQAIQAQFPRLAETGVSLWRAGRRFGGWPYRTEFALLSHWQPRPGEALIDIGAHKGQAIDAVRVSCPLLEIHAFEPNPHLVGALAKRYFNDDALAIYACGLGREEGQSRFFMPVYGNHIFDQYGSFAERRCRTALSRETLTGFDPERLEMMACDAQHFTLDEIEINAGLIHLSDTGNERAILDGARDTLKHCAPLVIGSLSRDVQTVLTTEHNYVPVNYRSGRLHAAQGRSGYAIYVPYQRRQSLERAGLT